MVHGIGGPVMNAIGGLETRRWTAGAPAGATLLILLALAVAVPLLVEVWSASDFRFVLAPTIDPSLNRAPTAIRVGSALVAAYLATVFGRRWILKV